MRTTRQTLVALAILLLAACGTSDPPPAAPELSPAATSAPEPHVSFFSFGDWGTATQDQLDVAAAVDADCRSKPCDFGLLLGDNFYDHGVSSTSDPQWQTKFESVYGF